MTLGLECSKLQSPHRTVGLPVLSNPPRVRPSRTSRWRALSLIIVHLLIIGHVLHWWMTGRTLSPVEPSEAMYTLNDGHLNAGFIFFALALLVTLIGGRFVCGWACHIVAYQDLCAWLLKKIGIHPKPFRARLLVLAPLALALYMFVWPTAYRWYVGASLPELSNHLLTTEFWKTFPGPAIAVLTVAVCGFAIVYFLGSKGFCTYACPYGGFFAVADRVAPGRIRVTDDCEHCGHCTAVCTSNVRVHEEVAKFGMVVDPGCMKCMDCISVCPNDALYFGFTPIQSVDRERHDSVKARRHEGTKARRNQSVDRERHANQSRDRQGADPLSPTTRHFDFTLREELLFALIGLAALLAFRGLYGQIPLLLAMGMAAMTGWVFIKFLHLLRNANVRFQNLSLKRGGRLSRTGCGFLVGALLLCAFAAHSAAVQWFAWSGQRLRIAATIGDEVWQAGNDWWSRATGEQRESITAATANLERAERWGLLSTPAILQDLTWLYLAQGRASDAESTVRALVRLTPDVAEWHRGLGNVLRMSGRLEEAEKSYRTALTLDPAHTRVHGELASSLLSQGRTEDAKRELRSAVSTEASAALFSMLGMLELQTGEPDAGVADLRRALDLDPSLSQTRYQLAVALLSMEKETDRWTLIDEAIEHLLRVTSESPEFAAAHYNLAVAVFMSGNPADAVAHVEAAIRLDPQDAQAKQFLQFLQTQSHSAP